jgi:acetyl-CoA carboxylase biotin carboxyl carrier protein
MDLGLLEQMVRLMAAHDLSAMEVHDGDKRVVLHRGPVAQAGPAVYTLGPAAAPAATAGAPASTPAAAAAASAVAAAEEASFVAIKSPMVGTFYAAPSPDSKPFVSVGTSIDEETDVCVIEAMKVFNNIKAETRGTVARILVTNGQTVEYGQTLFLVKPA